MENNNNPTPFFDLAMKKLAILPTRSREIVAKRFGIASGKRETLEKIGRDFGITRERVRQIVSDAVKKIAKQTHEKEFLEMEEKIIFTIQENHGIITQEEAIEKLGIDGNKKEENAIKFFIECSKKIELVEEKNLIEKSWVVSFDILEKVKKAENASRKVMERKKKPVPEIELVGEICSTEKDLGKDECRQFLKVLAKIKKNIFGHWGLNHWPEINPRGIKDKIYLVMKKKKAPLHFTEIAMLIDEHKLGKRKAHPQTVHNELIKDNRYVLIGRGIYALSEWGYSKGTVRDIIKDFLQENGPTEKEKIVEEVGKMREVKKSTILINLNNSEIFSKKGEIYSVKN